MGAGDGFEAFDQGARMRRLSSSLEDPRWILTGIGALLLSASQRAFREEKMGKIKWKTRDETKMVPNWPAIVGHFSTKASAPPARNFHGQHTLTGTGRLRGSMAFRLVGEDTVEVGSNVPYAKALHEGGESETPTITKALQKRLWEWMKTRVGYGKNAKARHRNERAKRLTKSKVAKVKQRAGDIAIGMRDERMRKALDSLKMWERFSGDMPGNEVYKRQKANAKTRVNAARKAFLKSHRAEGRRLKSLEGPDMDRALSAALRAHASISSGMSSAKKDAARSLRAAVTKELGPSPRIVKPKDDSEMVSKLKWLLNPKLRGSPLTVNHPVRPLVGLPEDIREEIAARYGARVRIAK
jgi:phage gpG-like protein